MLRRKNDINDAVLGGEGVRSSTYFSLNCPGFDSQHSQEFFLGVAEIT